MPKPKTRALSRPDAAKLRGLSLSDAAELEEIADKLLTGCRQSAGVLSPLAMDRATRRERPVGHVAIRNAWHVRRVG